MQVHMYVVTAVCVHVFESLMSLISPSLSLFYTRVRAPPLPIYSTL